jgi:hypothetical protein
MTEVQFYMLATGLIATNAALFMVGRKLMRVEERLDRIRFAAYDLLKVAEADITDLRTSLKWAGIAIHTEERDERIRQMALSPEERRDESIQCFETVVAESERKMREMGL